MNISTTSPGPAGLVVVGVYIGAIGIIDLVGLLSSEGPPPTTVVTPSASDGKVTTGVVTTIPTTDPTLGIVGPTEVLSDLVTPKPPDKDPNRPPPGFRPEKIEIDPYARPIDLARGAHRRGLVLGLCGVSLLLGLVGGEFARVNGVNRGYEYDLEGLLVGGIACAGIARHFL